MARDRKRAKQRRERQARTAGTQRRSVESAPPRERPTHEHEPPEVASGEIDLAEAHVAMGRPELADAAPDRVPDVADDDADLPELEREADFEQLEDRVDDAEERFERASNGGGEAGTEVVERAERPSRAPATRDEGNRFANFLRGSWRELERVQWPDRRQVAQATAVVIGFVIVAGVFLGVMDFLASKIVELIV